jgi:HD superfamily phosphohydrolase
VKDTPYIAQLVGTRDLWEPLWGLKTRLTEVEVSLLHSSALRRLQFIHHSGCSYINTQHTSTRLQHTIGVFSLIANMCPDWSELRVAALLHDIGHSPFSHTLEHLAGIDHHKNTESLIYASEISGILIRNGFRLTEILDLMNGNVVNPLCNHANKLNLDHLDGWVRSGQITGVLTISRQELLSKLSLQEGCIATNPETAELLLQLIISEAQFHCSSINMGPNTVLKNLVAKLIDHQVISPEKIGVQTDAWLEYLLMDCEWTSQEMNRLLYRPYEIKVTRDYAEAPSDAFCTELKKLYLSVPVIKGNSASLTTLPSFPLIGDIGIK